MLNLTQSNELNRALRLQTFLNGNTAIFLTFLPFNTAYTLFKGNVNNFSTQANLKDSSGTGITQTKEQLKKSIAINLGHILGKTTAYCDATGNTTLKAKVYFSESDIFRMKDADILPFVTNLNTNVFTAAQLADATFATYNITAAQIATIVTDATTFNNKIGVADVVDAGSSTANDNITDIITAIHKNIATMDSLVGDFNAAHPDFVDGYHKNSTLDKLGTRHTGIQGVVTQNGVPKKDVHVTVDGTNKLAITDINGHYAIIRVSPKLYEVKAANEGGDAQTKTFNIRQGHIDELNFEL